MSLRVLVMTYSMTSFCMTNSHVNDWSKEAQLKAHGDFDFGQAPIRLFSQIFVRKNWNAIKQKVTAF